MLDDRLKQSLLKTHEVLLQQGRLLSDERLTKCFSLFRTRFGPDVLKKLDGEELLNFMHARPSKDSLVYWLEFKNDEEFPAQFGSIAGGNSLKFGFYWRQETSAWTTGSPQKQVEISLADAIAFAKKQRDQLVAAADLLEKFPERAPDADYLALQEQMDRLAPDVSRYAWGHKYLSLLYPTKLDDYHNSDFQHFYLVKVLQIPPDQPGLYVSAGRFVQIAGEISLPINHLTAILNERTPKPRPYWRVGTRLREEDSIWSLMRDHNCVAMGWAELGNLAEVQPNQDFREAISARLAKELGNEPNLASRKAGEIHSFVKGMAEGDLVLAADGRTILGIGRITGDYRFDPAFEKDAPQRRPVEWLSQEAWELPVPEGLRTTVVELKKHVENLIEIERRLLAPSALPPQASLAAPFNEFFASFEEAQGGFDLLKATLLQLGVNPTAFTKDARISLSLAGDKKEGDRLRLNFGNWAILTFNNLSAGESRVDYLCRADLIPASSKQAGEEFVFTDQIDGFTFSSGSCPLAPLQSSTTEESKAFRTSVALAAKRFATWEGSRWKENHEPKVLQMVFDPQLRDHLLRTGLNTAPERNFWWVNQGKTYDAAKAGGFIWAPQKSKDGNAYFHWENVSRVQPGDIVFNYADKLLRAVSVVKAAPYESDRGALQGDWSSAGWRADLTYHELGTPIPSTVIGPAIGALNLLRGPINQEGRVNQGYLFGLTKEAAEIIFQEIGTENLPPAIRNALDGTGGVTPGNSFASLLRRYHDERIVFSSSVHRVRYAITAWDQTGVSVERLDANEPQRVTFSQAEKLILQVREAGSLAFTTLDDTSAIRNTVLQAEPLALTADKTQIRFLEDPDLRLKNFLDVLGNLNMANPLYKPAMLLCVLDGLDQGQLPENQISFDWIAPRFIAKMKALGKDVTEQQAAQPFYHLSGDLFWLHAVPDLKDLMQDGGEGSTAARKKINYALIKDTYWNLLQDPQNRREARQMLEELIVPKHSPNALLPAAYNAIKDTGFVFASATLRRFVGSLATKPFVILTGNSGTGKTKLAELFAQWLCGDANHRFTLVPVGADWTDNRNVLGFVNHLRPTKPKGEDIDVPIYQSTEILNLLLAAKNDPTHPFFLILDEMNLSHVERYFADFLSTLESLDGHLLLHREGRDLPRKPGGTADVSAVLPLPRNVFVIGTVNVDETTYMFSPKVLDRANVIEFRMDRATSKAFLTSGGQRLANVTPASLGYAQTFLELSNRARQLKGLPLSLVSDPTKQPGTAQAGLEECRKTLADLFALMRQRHQEFAFRTMAETLRFLAVDYELTAEKNKWDWQSAMDAQILQKILPKLHGSKRKIGSLLAALATYCEKENNYAAAEEVLKNEPKAESYPATEDKRASSPRFTDSHRKLCEMIEAVRRDQFVSYIQ